MDSNENKQLELAVELQDRVADLVDALHFPELYEDMDVLQTSLDISRIALQIARDKKDK